MKKILSIILASFFLQTHGTHKNDWQWVRLRNERGDVILHLSRAALSSQQQERTCRTLRLSVDDIHDLRNGIIPRSYKGARHNVIGIEFGSKLPGSDSDWESDSEDS